MKILIAVDDEQYGVAMAQWVANHHWPAESEVRIISVVAWRPSDRDLSRSKEMALFMEGQHRFARELIESVKLKIQEPRPYLRIEGEVLEGHPAERILSTATAFGADMIVLGSHGRSGLKLFVMGSVSMAVVHNAPCSVMTVRLSKVPQAIAGSLESATA